MFITPTALLRNRRRTAGGPAYSEDATLLFDPTLLSMPSWEEFDVIFYFNPSFVYDGKLFDQILLNRRALGTQLFVDRLLTLLDIKPGPYNCVELNDAIV